MDHIELVVLFLLTLVAALAAERELDLEDQRLEI